MTAPPAQPKPLRSLMTPDLQEALSTVHARDTFRLRQLASGRWAVWNQTLTLLGIVETLAETIPLTDDLRRRANADFAQAEAERFALLRRVEEQRLLDELDLEIEL